MHARAVGLSREIGGMVQALLWAFGSVIVFQAAGLVTKQLGAAVPPIETATIRTAAAVLLIGAAWGAWHSLRDPWIHVVRAALGAFGILCLTHAYGTLPLALATAVFYSRVLLMIPLAHVFLRERAGRDLWAAALVGFAGIVVALWPKLAAPEVSLGVLSIVGAAVASSGSQTAVKRLTATNPPALIVAANGVLGCAMLGAAILVLLGLSATVLPELPAEQVLVLPRAWEAAGLVGIGLLSATSQYCMARSYRLAPASFIAPISYLEIPVAAAIGYAVASEVPSAHTVVGSVIIIGATAYVTQIRDRYRYRGTAATGRC